MEMKQPQPLPFMGHVIKIFEVLDELYEYGPTLYYSRPPHYACPSTIEEGYHEFYEAVNGINVTRINIALERITLLHNRRRVMPLPKEFRRICQMSEKEWHVNKRRYQARKECYADD